MLDKTIVTEMGRIDPSFRNTGIFSPSLLRSAYENLGHEFEYAMVKSFNKVGRGQYSLDGEKTEPRAVPAKRIKAVANPVVDTVEYTAPEVVASSFDTKVQRNNTYSEVPRLDPSYIPYGNYRDLERIIKSRKFYPTFITGHSGNGKSSQITHICAKNNIPMIRMNMTSQTDEERLIGTKTLVDGSIVVVEGPVIVAMRSGAVLLIDEMSAANANAILCMQSIMEGSAYYFSLTGEWIYPKKGFNIIATDNTKGKGSDDGRYIGTNILNEAFLERFSVTFEQEFPTQAVEKKMVLNWMEREGCVDDAFAEDLCKWSDATRRTFRDGAIDDLIATRRLEHIVGAFAIFGDKKKAVELCVNRFDSLTRDAFIQLFDKVSSEIIVVPPKTTENENEVPF